MNIICKKKIVLLCLCFLPLLSVSQTAVDTTLFRNPENYNLALQHYLNQIAVDTIHQNNYYQAACYYTLLKNQELAFPYLKNAIVKGARGEDVITDTDFNLIK